MFNDDHVTHTHRRSQVGLLPGENISVFIIICMYIYICVCVSLMFFWYIYIYMYICVCLLNVFHTGDEVMR